MTYIAIPSNKGQTTQHSAIASAILNRRSFYPRQYTGDKIRDEVITELLSLANMAPSHKLTFPWRFKVLSAASKDELIDFQKEFYLRNTPSEEVKESKVNAYEERKGQISHILAIVAHYDREKRVPEIEETMAVACAVQNMYLALDSFGLGGYWSTGKVAFSAESHAYLKLNENEKLLGFFCLGTLIPEISLPVPKRNNEFIEWLR